MADQKINALPTKTTPTSGDKCLMSGAAEEYLIDYDKLATAILNKLTSKTFTLDQGTKTLIAAINELNSKTSLVQSIDAGALSTSTYQSLQEACQHIVDNVLTNKEGTFFFVFFRYGSDVMMIAQKYQWDDNYGAYLAFGYGLNDLVYQNKMSGEWK